MVTKEQCLLEQILDEVDYGRNDRLTQAVVNAYNAGKQYASDMVFQNDERGLDQGLEGYSPSFIVYSLIGEDSEYNARDPFFVIENGIKSIDGYDFRRMLTPEDQQKLVTEDVLDELSDCDTAFDTFVRQNYPQQYDSISFDDLYDMGYRTTGHVLQADWNQLVKELIQYSQQQNQMNEAIKLTEGDLKEITNKILNEIRKKGKK